MGRGSTAEAVRAPGQEATGARVEVVESLEGLRALQPEWDELYDLQAEAIPGMSWEWCYHWQRHYGGGHQVKVVMLRDPQGLLLGLVPLMRLPGRWCQPRELRFLSDYGKGGAGDLELLLRPGHEHLAVAALCSYLDGSPDWDRIRLTCFRAESDGLWRLCQQAVGRSLRAEMRFHSWTIYMAMQGSFEDYLRTLSKHRRTYVRHWLKRLAAAHAVGFGPVMAEEEIQEAVDWLVRLKRERIRQQGQWTWFDQPQYPRFLKEVCLAAAAKGRLRLFRLTLDGVMAGCMLGFAGGHTVALYSYAYDPAQAALRVPDALIANTIKSCLEEGARVIEFGRGDAPHKAHYMKERYPIVRLDVYRSQPRSLFAEVMAHAAPPLWHGVQALLPQRVMAALSRRLKREAAPEAHGHEDQEETA